MSWIQNFFQKLRKEEDDEKISDYILHREPENHISQSPFDNLKDLDARISYQYPKGGSTTPTPRTTKSTQRQVTNRPKKPVDSSGKSRLEEIPKVTSELPKFTSKIPKITSKIPIIPTNNIMEPKPRQRGPFQPTEIPSPVFGFNRPQKTTTTVEHELSHFFQGQLDTDVDKGLDSSVNQTIVQNQNKTNDNPLQGLLNQLNQINQVELKMDVPVSVVETESLQDKPNELESEEDVQVKVNEQPFEERVPVETNELTFEIENDQTLAEISATTESEVPPAPRSRLPFNVMMLTQDKQKWEERKRKREQEHVLKPHHQEIKTTEEAAVVESVVLPSNCEEEPKEGSFIFPGSQLLSPPVTEVLDTEWIDEQKELLNQTLKNFNVGASVVNVTQGPSVTRFEVQPEPGVKVNKITNLSDDIKLSLAARDIRIEAPIPGKHTIGIEVPNQKSRPVLINEIIGSPIFKVSASPLTAVLGLDIAGKPIVTDLKKMPHGLIAGATGSGKSVCINSILISLLYKADPRDLKLLLIDPKMVELAPYNRIPHLVSPVITDVKAATAALKWAVDEMERRYELFAHTGVRDINRFNELADQHKRYSDKLPFIVIIIDELADLMMMSPADVEEAICRIAQKARACGIHLIVATQRPSVDVITGLIKANIPTRIAFSVSSQVDSRTIIDISGAERLLGRGDMLFLENGASKPVRLQGTFVSDEEIDLVVAHVRDQQEPDYLFEQEELLKKAQVIEEEDELFYEACEFIVSNGGASTSSLQRRFKIGYNRAARLMDMLEQNGYISSANGSKPRDVLITEADLQSMQD
ncbi:S-DNA-T family DNA segregation ATPase FtsK/SpoIIIE [Neobacillus cucumis]|nr:S-DNA-T family DNA segregation ATPase FtsK/SpoIIIE [Neobacillus cucumis]